MTTPRPTDRMRIDRGPDSEILVSGEVDLATSRVLRATLEEAAAANGPLVVDLREVTLLQSSGVAALFEVADHGLTVRVRAGSAVASVMRICGLGHVAEVVALTADATN